MRYDIDKMIQEMTDDCELAVLCTMSQYLWKECIMEQYVLEGDELTSNTETTTSTNQNVSENNNTNTVSQQQGQQVSSKQDVVTKNDQSNNQSNGQQQSQSQQTSNQVKNNSTNGEQKTEDPTFLQKVGAFFKRIWDSIVGFIKRIFAKIKGFFTKKKNVEIVEPTPEEENETASDQEVSPLPTTEELAAKEQSTTEPQPQLSGPDAVIDQSSNANSSGNDTNQQTQSGEFDRSSQLDIQELENEVRQKEPLIASIKSGVKSAIDGLRNAFGGKPSGNRSTQDIQSSLDSMEQRLSQLSNANANNNDDETAALNDEIASLKEDIETTKNLLNQQNANANTPPKMPKIFNLFPDLATKWMTTNDPDAIDVMIRAQEKQVELTEAKCKLAEAKHQARLREMEQRKELDAAQNDQRLSQIQQRDQLDEARNNHANLMEAIRKERSTANYARSRESKDNFLRRIGKDVTPDPRQLEYDKMIYEKMTELEEAMLKNDQIAFERKKAEIDNIKAENTIKDAHMMHYLLSNPKTKDAVVDKHEYTMNYNYSGLPNNPTVTPPGQPPIPGQPPVPGQPPAPAPVPGPTNNSAPINLYFSPSIYAQGGTSENSIESQGGQGGQGGSSENSIESQGGQGGTSENTVTPSISNTDTVSPTVQGGTSTNTNTDTVSPEIKGTVDPDIRVKGGTNELQQSPENGNPNVPPSPAPVNNPPPTPTPDPMIQQLVAEIEKLRNELNDANDQARKRDEEISNQLKDLGIQTADTAKQAAKTVQQLEDQKSELEKAKEDIDNRIDELKSAGQTQSDELTQLQTQLTDIDGKIADVKQQQKDQSDIVTQNIQAMASQINQNTTALNTLGKGVANQQTAITNLGNDVSTMQDSIKDMQGNINGVQDSIKDMQGNIDGMKNGGLTDTQKQEIAQLIQDNIPTDKLENLDAVLTQLNDAKKIYEEKAKNPQNQDELNEAKAAYEKAKMYF